MTNAMTLEAKLVLLMDKDEIRELINIYPQRIAAKDWQGLANLFTEDAVLDFSDLVTFARPRKATTSERDKSARLTFHGRAEIGAFFPIAGRLDMRPFFSNEIIVVDGDRARAVSSFEHRLTQGTESVIGAGRMFDEFARIEGRWLIAYRRQELFYFTGLHEGWAEGEDRDRIPPVPARRDWEATFISQWRGGR